jgi:hypothetical protein
MWLCLGLRAVLEAQVVLGAAVLAAAPAVLAVAAAAAFAAAVTAAVSAEMSEELVPLQGAASSWVGVVVQEVWVRVETGVRLKMGVGACGCVCVRLGVGVDTCGRVCVRLEVAVGEAVLMRVDECV